MNLENKTENLEYKTETFKNYVIYIIDNKVEKESRTVSKDTVRVSAKPYSDCTNLKTNKMTRTTHLQKSLHNRVREKIGHRDPKSIPIINSIVQYMNDKLPGHKMKGYKPNGKPYKNYSNFLRYLRQLKTGTYGKFWNLPKEYIDKIGITQEALSHMFSDQEIKQTINRMSGLYEECNYPKNKIWLNGLSRDLLLYNPGNKNFPSPSSLFLEVYVDGVQEIAELYIQKEWNKSPYKKQGEQICEIFQVASGDWGKKGKILRYMNEIAKFSRSLEKINCWQLDYFHAKDPAQFIQSYIDDYLVEAHNESAWYREKREISCLSLKNKLFYQYLDHIWSGEQLAQHYGLSYYLDKFLWGKPIADKKDDKKIEESGESAQAVRESIWGNKTNQEIKEEQDFMRTLSSEELDRLYPIPGEGNSVQGCGELSSSSISRVKKTWVDPFDPAHVKKVFEGSENEDDYFDDGIPL